MSGNIGNPRALNPDTNFSKPILDTSHQSLIPQVSSLYSERTLSNIPPRPLASSGTMRSNNSYTQMQLHNNSGSGLTQGIMPRPPPLMMAQPRQIPLHYPHVPSPTIVTQARPNTIAFHGGPPLSSMVQPSRPPPPPSSSTQPLIQQQRQLHQQQPGYGRPLGSYMQQSSHYQQQGQQPPSQQQQQQQGQYGWQKGPLPPRRN